MKNPFRIVPSTAFFVLILLLICSVSLHVQAQFDSLGLNIPWRKGSIALRNETLKGLIQFNDKLAMIKFKETSDAEESSFAETSVLAMQFFDADQSRWRRFATFNLKEEATGKQGALLFEILVEFKKFALLSRTARVNVATRAYNDYYTGMTHVRKVGYEQFEGLCLVNEDGAVSVVLVVNEFEKDRLSVAAPLEPLLNKKTIQKYLGDQWETFRTIVKKNKLKLKRKDHFIRAFELLKEMQLDA